MVRPKGRAPVLWLRLTIEEAVQLRDLLDEEKTEMVDEMTEEETRDFCHFVSRLLQSLKEVTR